jgi:hypothetical protein
VIEDSVPLVVLNVVFVVVGLTLVRAFGIPLTGVWLPTAFGLAPVTGMLACSLVAAQLAAFGIPVGIITVPVATVAAIAAVTLVGRRVQPSRGSLRPQEQSRLGTAVELGALCLLAVVSFNAVRLAAVMPLSSWDGWAIWGARAHTLFESGDAWSAPFQEQAYAPQHLDYPLLYPSLEALGLHAIGRFDVSLVDIQPMLLLVACALAVWALLRTAVPPWLAAIAGVGLLGCGTLVQNASWNYADGVLAAISALGLVCLGLWLTHASSVALWLAGLFLTSSALLKNEGLMFAFAALVAALAASLISGRRMRPLLFIGAAIVVARAPWQAFVAINGLDAADFDFASLASPTYLVHNADRVELASRALAFDLIHTWTLPIAAGALVLLGCLQTRQYALFVLVSAWAMIVFAGLVASYVASKHDVIWHLGTSSDRVVATLATGLLMISPLVGWKLWSVTRAELERVGRSRFINPNRVPAAGPSRAHWPARLGQWWRTIAVRVRCRA